MTSGTTCARSPARSAPTGTSPPPGCARRGAPATCRASTGGTSAPRLPSDALAAGAVHRAGPRAHLGGRTTPAARAGAVLRRRDDRRDSRARRVVRGAPELHHPVRGRVKGVAAFERFAIETKTWLAEHSATAEDVDFVLTPGCGVEELIVHL